MIFIFYLNITDINGVPGMFSSQFRSV